MNTNTRLSPAKSIAPTRAPAARPSLFGRTLAGRASLGDPRFGRIDSGLRTRLWNQALIDRLQSPLPLTRHHD